MEQRVRVPRVRTMNRVLTVELQLEFKVRAIAHVLALLGTRARTVSLLPLALLGQATRCAKMAAPLLVLLAVALVHVL